MTHQRSTFVTAPLLPKLETFQKLLPGIWERNRLTNNGPLLQKFEEELARYLDVPFLSVVSNATMGLILALKASNLKGEVLTTPYSFIATAHALLWNGLTPVFADVNPLTGNLDPEKVEPLINENTAAILPVHVYGSPCDMEAFSRLGSKHNLTIIYDAAHAFGVQKGGRSILIAGDLSILSFHATKAFNSVEGGAIVCKLQEQKRALDSLRNFGFMDEATTRGIGLNAKMSELHAAFGLSTLEVLGEALKGRQLRYNHYSSQLAQIPGVRYLSYPADVTPNYSYYPLFIDEEIYGESRDALYKRLKDNGLFARRYFYPLISQFTGYTAFLGAQANETPNAHKLSQSVLCLPFSHNLDLKTMDRIVSLIGHH